MTSVNAVGNSPVSPEKALQLRQQAEELESVFLNTLMKQMFTSIKTDESVMGGGFAEETWRGMQAEQMSASVTRAGGIGIADAIFTELLAAQEASQTPRPTGA